MQKFFSLEEARILIPTLRQMLREAHDELAEKLDLVRAANKHYEKSELLVDAIDDSAGVEPLRAARAQFQDAIQNLSAAQNAYINRLNYFVDRITEKGVVLRDISDGLLDFPCQSGDFDYLLCWRMDEADISHWHLANDGFIGRKPLSALSEYLLNNNLQT